MKKYASIIRNKTRLEKILILAVVAMLFIVLVLVIENISNRFSTEVPSYGGRIKEGILGFPTNINPILAKSNADFDLAALTFSGLVKLGGDGEIELDLAQSFTVSEDMLSYTFILRDDIFFHDNTAITADDVVFTFEKIKSPATESPLLSIFTDVLVTTSSFNTITFTLPEEDAGFLYELTVGIIPRHLWEGVVPGSIRYIELLSHPVGSGPYKVSRVKRDTTLGVATQYTLTPHTRYKGGRAYIQSIDLFFFATEDELLQALRNRTISSVALLSGTSLENISTRRKTIEEKDMLRVFGVFFNSDTASPVREKAVRDAIDAAIDRDMLAENIFSGYARSTRIPLPLNQITPHTLRVPNEHHPTELLEDAGWEENSETGIREKDGELLSFTIKTGESNELKNTAAYLQNILMPYGFHIEVESFDVQTFNQAIIRERDYDVLLFGQAYSQFIDPYPFWHSANVEAPGLNISGFSSDTVDQALASLRSEFDERAREELLSQVVDEILDETPAVFLYSPTFLYVRNSNVNNVVIPQVERSSDRFSNIEEWFIYTDTIWNVFLKNN